MTKIQRLLQIGRTFMQTRRRPVMSGKGWGKNAKNTNTFKWSKKKLLRVGVFFCTQTNCKPVLIQIAHEAHRGIRSQELHGFNTKESPCQFLLPTREGESQMSNIPRRCELIWRNRLTPGRGTGHRRSCRAGGSARWERNRRKRLTPGKARKRWQRSSQSKETARNRSRDKTAAQVKNTLPQLPKISVSGTATGRPRTSP